MLLLFSVFAVDIMFKLMFFFYSVKVTKQSALTGVENKVLNIQYSVR